MTIFTYIASNDPEAARAICSKYGFAVQNVTTSEDLGVCLEQLVGEVGEPAMRDIYSIHPDKDQLVALYGNNAAPVKDDCGCKKKNSQKSMKDYMNQLSTNSNTQIQFCIVAAALLLAAAIISK